MIVWGGDRLTPPPPPPLLRSSGWGPAYPTTSPPILLGNDSPALCPGHQTGLEAVNVRKTLHPGVLPSAHSNGLQTPQGASPFFLRVAQEGNFRDAQQPTFRGPRLPPLALSRSRPAPGRRWTDAVGWSLLFSDTCKIMQKKSYSSHARTHCKINTTPKKK